MTKRAVEINRTIRQSLKKGEYNGRTKNYHQRDKSIIRGSD